MLRFLLWEPQKRPAYPDELKVREEKKPSTRSGSNQPLPGTSVPCCQTHGRNSMGLCSSHRSNRRTWFLRSHDPRKASSPAGWPLIGRMSWVVPVHVLSNLSVSHSP